MRASMRVKKPRCVTKVKSCFIATRGGKRLPSNGAGLHHRHVLEFILKPKWEYACWDPKDGELCLGRTKPGETLVEVRSDTDVQIVRQTCA